MIWMEPFITYCIFGCVFTPYRFSSWLLKHAVMTLDAMLQGFEKCFTPSPYAIRTTDVYDIASWLTPHLNTMTGHSKPHCFRITQSDNGKAIIHWKQWMTCQVLLNQF
jgi:hypothetical protein